MTPAQNPLLPDREADFWLNEVLDLPALLRLPAFQEHGPETFAIFIDSARRLARDVLLPAFRPMDEAPATLREGRVFVHPLLKQILPRLIDLGLLTATRPAEVGGQSLPLCVASLAHLYLMAGNASAYGYIGLSTGAAHLIEAFGDAALRRTYMERIYSGEWTGTMALTEPQAGSSLADVKTRATPTAEGHYLLEGSKIFISGGDHDLTDNVVHLALARIAGAPAGVKGISLFVVPARRPTSDGGALVDNDVRVAGLVHKIGWRGLPSVILSLGEAGDCHGYLLGEPHQGLAAMFQMMNEARIMVGLNGVASAAVAYQEALAYARARPQGRPPLARDPAAPQSVILGHADVRRMLLRQKAIVEGGLGLLLRTARYADLAAHAVDNNERQRAGRLCDLLTPVAKSFPAEWGFEANALAVQVHGGYGYSSEYLPEAWLREQKLNSIHEGTTGIHSIDLLGRKIGAEGGAALRDLHGEVSATLAQARAAGVAEAWCAALQGALDEVLALSQALVALRGDGERMIRHSAHFLQLFCIVVVTWSWIEQAALSQAALQRGDDPFYQGKLCAAQYWVATELPRVAALCALCRSEDDSYARIQDAWF